MTPMLPKLRFRLLLVLFFLGLLLILLRSAFDIEQPNFALRLLHTNDHHAHLEPAKVGDREFGGIARRSTLIEQLRAENKASREPLLLLSAGDIFQGTLFFNQYLGLADLDFYNALDYNVATIGNHEFDKGQKVLADFVKGAEFPIICANLQTAATSPLKGLIKPWVILTMNRQKIGIFGLVTPETATLSNPGDGVTFTDPIVAAQTAVKDLTAQGANKIIALTHIGFPQDLQLARQVPGIDVVIGGHTHTPVGNIIGAENPYPVVEKTPDGSPVLVVTDWEWGKYLGDLDVTFDPKGQLVSWTGEPHALDAQIKPDPAFTTKLEKYQKPIQALRQKVIGSSTVMLNGERADVRTSETNLGNLIADAILAKTSPDKTQIAIINSGGIRASIPQGEVTVGEVLEVLPFGNTISRLDLTGAQIAQALENGVSNISEGGGSFPQVSGLRFIWQQSAPVGKRITDIEVRTQDGSYQPINPSATYRVVTNSFMLNGGDGYSVFTQGKNKIDTGFLQSDVVIEYIAAKSPLNLQVEGRIQQAKEPIDAKSS